MFNAYFKGISDEQKQVWGTLTGSNPVNFCLRNSKRWLRPRLFQHLSGFKNALTLQFLGSSTKEEEEKHA